MTDTMSNRQIILTLFLSVTTYSVMAVPGILAKTAGRSGWLMIIAAAVPFAVMVYLISRLAAKYPDKIMFDYSREILGNKAAVILAVYFILYFLFSGIYLKIDLVDVLSSNFLPKTPRFVFYGVLILLSSFVAGKGGTGAVRLAEITGIMFLFTSILVCIIMTFSGDVYNILPLFNMGDITNIKELAGQLLIPFGGFEIILILPFGSQNKKVPVLLFAELIFIGAFYALVTLCTVKILGINNTALLNDAFIEAIKSAPAPVIERLDIFYLTFGLAGLISGLAITFTGAVEFALKLFPKVKRWAVSAILGTVMFAFSLIIKSLNGYDKILHNVFLPLVIVSGFVIPSVLLIGSAINKKGQQVAVN